MSLESAVGYNRIFERIKKNWLFYRTNINDNKIRLFAEASWADYLLTRRSKTEIHTFLGGHIVYWSSKGQRRSLLTVQRKRSIWILMLLPEP